MEERNKISVIEIRENLQGYDLLIDGEVLHNKSVSVEATRYNNTEMRYRLYTSNPDAANKIGKVTSVQIPPYVEQINLFDFLPLGYGVNASIHIDLYTKRFYVNPALDLFGWKHPWSAMDYNDMLKSLANENKTFAKEEGTFLRLEVRDTITNRFWGGLESIAVALERFSTEAKLLHSTALDLVKANLSENSVTTLFDFPEAVKVPCEQYLQYFVQFLKDAGVGATADLTHEAGKVLFTVTPDSKDVALDKIRQALDVYVHLPGNPSLGITPYFNESIMVQRMGITLQTFQNQLALITMENRQLESENRAKQQVIEAKDIAIQALQFAMTRQSPADAETFVQAVKVVTEKDTDKEKLKVFSGAVYLKKYDGGWFEIDAPKIARECKLPEIFEGVKRILTGSNSGEEG